MRLSSAIQGYKVSKLGEGLSKSTMRGYETHYKQLIEFVGDIEISEVTQDHLQRFTLYLREDYVPHRLNGDTSSYKTITMRNVWCAIRSLFGWANEELGIERPDLALKMPKVSYPEIQPFSKEDLDKIMKAAIYAPTITVEGKKPYRRKHQNGYRNKAIILVLLDTGMRVSECAGLRVKDINFENGEVFVRPINAASKNKSRTLRLGTSASKAVWRYLSERDLELPDDPLFLTNDNHPITRGAIGQILKRIGKNAGVSKVHPHRFRHTFALQFLRNGGDVFTLQHALGHTDWAMTRHYANLAQDDLNAVHRRASSVDNWRL
jgi:integrase/recombinase XerD